MSTLPEIESAADLLPAEQKEELLRFLVVRLQKERVSSKRRDDSDEELAAMITENRPARGKASEWLRAAKGSIHAAAGESADDARMAYYVAKYGVRP